MHLQMLQCIFLISSYVIILACVRIDVDHDKLNDLNLRAQNAWKPVEVHEVDVDPVTLFAAVFCALALVLFTVPLAAGH